MTDRELMQQALEYIQEVDYGPYDNLSLITALRDRMSQPEPLFSTPDVTPEVTPYVIDCPRCGHCCPQHNQKPVKDRLDFWALFDENQRLRAELKFNTTPPQRPWVGLTDEEIDDAARYCVKSGQSVNAAIRGIEAKLKEKNTWAD